VGTCRYDLNKPTGARPKVTMAVRITQSPFRPRARMTEPLLKRRMRRVAKDWKGRSAPAEQRTHELTAGWQPTR